MEEFRINKNKDIGRDLINEYTRKNSLIIGEDKLDLEKVKEYLKENWEQGSATTEEIEKAVKEINESIDNIKTSVK